MPTMICPMGMAELLPMTELSEEQRVLLAHKMKLETLDSDFLDLQDDLTVSFAAGTHEQELRLPLRFDPEVPEVPRGDREGLGQKPGSRSERHPVSSTSNRELRGLFCDNQARILLVEDNLTNRQVALSVLEKLGLQAHAVENGAEALEILKVTPYDLVLMDVQMPVMDGIEATRLIRNPASRVLNHAIPIIAMTANVMQGDQEKYLAAGMDDYLSKPFTVHSLADCLKKWLLSDGGPAENGPTEGNPVWDSACLMESLRNDEKLAKTILSGFIADIPHQLQVLKAFLEAGDGDGVQRQIHKIGGASSMICGRALSAVAFAMEKRAKAGDLAYVDAGLAELEAEFDSLKLAIVRDTAPER